MTPLIELSSLPIVDAHCHSYLETPKVLSGEELARYTSIAAQPDFLVGSFAPSENQVRRSHDRLATMYREQPFLKHLVRLLSEFLRCEDDLETVAKSRSAHASSFDSYVRQLFENVGIRGLVLDGAYPPLADEDLKRFPAKAVKIFRVETFIKDLLERHSSFEKFCSAYESGIRDAVKLQGHVGLKSIIGYRTGLNVRRVEFDEAMKEFNDAKEGRAELAWFGPKVKKLRDFLIVRAMELSIELDVPMQIHTGIGDYEIVLDQCDPSLLFDLFKDEQLRHATVVLVHSGFPHNQSAAYMASVLPNIFVDFSLTIPFLNPVAHERLMEILQLAPSSKIMYGSDGFNLPELFWLGAKVGKRTLGKCLTELVASGLFDEDQAYRIAKRILFENANELYHVGLT